MSGHIKASLITAIAESIGIDKLSPDAAKVLAPDIEYRLRDIVQVILELGLIGMCMCEQALSQHLQACSEGLGAQARLL